MKQINVKTNKVVKSLQVNGGWTTVEYTDGTTEKMRNGAVKDMLQEVKAESGKKAAPIGKPIVGNVHDYTCPHCGIDLDNGVGDHIMDTNDEPNKVMTKEYMHFCMACDGEFGPKVGKFTNGPFIRHVKQATYDVRDYDKVKSALGNPSLDNGDDVAIKLRGYTIDETYEVASRILESTIEALQKRYKHLNDGMQRMCLGNAIRGHIKKHGKPAAKVWIIA